MSPSVRHEALLELFRQRPSLAADLLGDALPIGEPRYATVVDSALTDAVPIERAADLVLRFSATPDGPPRLVVVVEAQLQEDAAKHDTWWAYLGALRSRYRCPAVLVVVTTSERVARWARQPIPLGHPGTTLTPLVIGPSDVPVIEDATLDLADPELGVLSAIVDGRSTAAIAIARAVFTALGQLDDDRTRIYNDIVLASLDAAARATLEDLMAYEYQSDFAKRHYAIGRAEGIAAGKAEGIAVGSASAKAAAVLAVLDTRGVTVPASVRARVLACTDLPLLDTWLARAVTATSAGDVIGE
jgi:hypothetical protein